MPLREAFEHVAAKAAELSAKQERTIAKAMRNILGIMVLSLRPFISPGICFLSPKTAAIVRPIPVRVNVKRIAVLGEKSAVTDSCRNIRSGRPVFTTEARSLRERLSELKAA